MSDSNGIKVLVVDDGRDNREFITNYILKPHGFIPMEAKDGIQGLEMVRQYQPDIILLDLQMPRMTGTEMLEHLQAERWDIPVILMTFHGSEEIAIEVYRMGVRDYVKKPYTAEEMLDAIERCLAEVRLRRDKEALTERLLSANARLGRRIREFTALFNIGKQVTALGNMNDLLTRIVNEATHLTGAEQGTLLLVEGDQLVCRASKRRGEATASIANDTSSDQIAWHCVRSGQPTVISPQEMQQHRARNPMLPAAAACVPLMIGGRVLGALSVEHTQTNARPFSNDDASLLSALSDYAAIAIENTRIYNELEAVTRREKETIRSAFARYVAPRVVERVLDNPDLLQPGGTRREISVLFADVRGYTTFSEHAPPETVVKTLNAYFELAAEVIFSREGTLDKYLGDAVMAIFNAPEDQPDHPYRAVDAALALQRAFAERNARIQGAEELTFGIGVHAGEVVVGNVGTSLALNYTAIGDTVNVAKRLQEHAQPGEILITGALVERLADMVEVESIGEMAVKGRQQPVQVYRLLALA